MARKFNLFKRFDQRLARELATQRVTIIKGLVCAGVTSLLTGSFVFLLRWVGGAVRGVGEGEVNMRTVGLAALATVGLYGVKYVFTRGQTYYLSRASARLAANMRIRLFAKLQRMPVAYFSRRRAGAIQSVLTNDVGVYQSAVTIIRDSIDGPLKMVVAFVTVVVISWQLGLLALLCMPPMLIVIQRNAKRMKKAQKAVQEDLASLNAMTQESLQGVRVIKAFSAEERMEGIYRKEVETAFRSQMTATRILATLKPLVEFIGAIAIALVLYVSGWLAFYGQLQVEDILAVALALDIVNQGFRNIASVNNTYAQVQAASERIYGEVLDMPEEQADEEGLRTLSDPQGRIEFRNVSFAYPDGTLALRDVSFVLEPGTSLALVGPSGAGKSTIADLVLRFYDPTEGQVLFDGVDVRELKVSWLRSQMGVVPQHTFLFAGSVADNIRLSTPDATDEDIREAARLAHADVFIEPTPHRYETELGEGGVRLSGGERQRVAIARALVRKPKVLLLDEATSALDATSERAVQEALDEVMQSRTTLFIAHRLTTAARANRILVLKHGEVMEEGSHRELLELGGEYAALFRVFSGGVLDERADDGG